MAINPVRSRMATASQPHFPISSQGKIWRWLKERSRIASASQTHFSGSSQGKIWRWKTGDLTWRVLRKRIPPGLLREVSMAFNPVRSHFPISSQGKFWGWLKGRSQWIFLNLPVLKGNFERGEKGVTPDIPLPLCSQGKFISIVRSDRMEVNPVRSRIASASQTHMLSASQRLFPISSQGKIWGWLKERRTG
jgi:hypothetical protein